MFGSPRNVTCKAHENVIQYKQVILMKKKLFGKNIVPDCSYCIHSGFENGVIACKKLRHIENNRCRAFVYDPLLRVPRSVTLHGNYTAEDFKL